MTPRDEAIRLIGSLPDDCTWDDVLDVVTRRVQRGGAVDARLAGRAAPEPPPAPPLDTPDAA